jgi:hypothetical protein
MKDNVNKRSDPFAKIALSFSQFLRSAEFCILGNKL